MQILYHSVRCLTNVMIYKMYESHSILTSRYVPQLVTIMRVS